MTHEILTKGFSSSLCCLSVCVQIGHRCPSVCFLLPAGTLESRATYCLLAAWLISHVTSAAQMSPQGSTSVATSLVHLDSTPGGLPSPLQVQSSPSPCSLTQHRHWPFCSLNMPTLASPPSLCPCCSLCLGCFL